MSRKTAPRFVKQLNLDDKLNLLKNADYTKEEKREALLKLMTKAKELEVRSQVLKYADENLTSKYQIFFEELINPKKNIDEVSDPTEKKMTAAEAGKKLAEAALKLKRRDPDAFKKYGFDDAVIEVIQRGTKRAGSVKKPSKADCSMYEKDSWWRELRKIGTGPLKKGGNHKLTDLKAAALCHEVDIKGLTKRDQIYAKLKRYGEKEGKFTQKKRDSSSESDDDDDEDEEDDEDTTEEETPKGGRRRPAVDEDSSSSSEEVARKPITGGRRRPTVDEDSSSSSEEAPRPPVPMRGGKQDTSSSSEEASRKTASTTGRRAAGTMRGGKQVKDEDSSSSSEEAPRASTSGRKVGATTARHPATTQTARRKPGQVTGGRKAAVDESSSEEDRPVARKSVTTAAARRRVDDDSSSEEDKPVARRSVTTAAARRRVDDDSSSEEDAPARKSGNGNNDDDESSDVEIPGKIYPKRKDQK